MVVMNWCVGCFMIGFDDSIEVVLELFMDNLFGNDKMIICLCGFVVGVIWFDDLVGLIDLVQQDIGFLNVFELEVFVDLLEGLEI